MNYKIHICSDSYRFQLNALGDKNVRDLNALVKGARFSRVLIQTEIIDGICIKENSRKISIIPSF